MAVGAIDIRARVPEAIGTRVMVTCVAPIS